ncbi:hypothetical protein MTR67_025751, partial [Solanum verrucosum]
VGLPIDTSTYVRYLHFKSEEILYWVFPWSQRFNLKEETSIALIYISFPSLPPNMFARKALLSIASVVGKPLAIDKATQIRSRPNTKRVKVLHSLKANNVEKLKGDVRAFLNAKTDGNYDDPLGFERIQNTPSEICELAKPIDVQSWCKPKWPSWALGHVLGGQVAWWPRLQGPHHIQEAHVCWISLPRSRCPTPSLLCSRGP